MAESVVYNIDCLEAMRQMPDKCFDLAVVDPPYGINAAKMHGGLGTSSKCSKKENRLWHPKNWDNTPPPKEYFDELFRVCVKQIIFGGNYFGLPPT